MPQSAASEQVLAANSSYQPQHRTALDHSSTIWTANHYHHPADALSALSGAREPPADLNSKQYSHLSSKKLESNYYDSLSSSPDSNYLSFAYFGNTVDISGLRIDLICFI